MGYEVAEASMAHQTRKLPKLKVKCCRGPTVYKQAVLEGLRGFAQIDAEL